MWRVLSRGIGNRHADDPLDIREQQQGSLCLLWVRVRIAKSDVPMLDGFRVSWIHAQILYENWG